VERRLRANGGERIAMMEIAMTAEAYRANRRHL
jgi:hypothetical protein